MLFRIHFHAQIGWLVMLQLLTPWRRKAKDRCNFYNFWIGQTLSIAVKQLIDISQEVVESIFHDCATVEVCIDQNGCLPMDS